MTTYGSVDLATVDPAHIDASAVKAARHPVVEERLLGRHRERPDIRAGWGNGGTELFDVTICPLRQARTRDVVENPLNL